MNVGFQIAEVLMFHKNMSKKDAYKEATKLLEIVGMPEPEKLGELGLAVEIERSGKKDSQCFFAGLDVFYYH